MIPELLKAGDEIRVIAPARGLKIIGQDVRKIARERFETLGLKVSFATNTTDENWDMTGSTTIEKRVADIHEAFADKNVKAIFTIIGGANSNQLLPYLDYDLIRKSPKFFCGFSDITALLNGIYAKTGLVTFSGPHFSSIGMLKGTEYTLDNLKIMLMGNRNNHITPSKEWSDDLWFLDQENRTFIKNEGYWTIHSGAAEGTIIGGNLGTFNLLLGSPYRPTFEKDTILFIEDTEGSDILDFERNLQALLYQPDFGNVKGLVIGRFQKGSKVTREQLEFILNNKKELAHLPIIANVDFGHSTPLLTFPIGGKATLSDGQLSLEI
ncbi:MAG: LD-carboxypeptidase [Alphaproteobacteria bacterium]|nr:LD-carboxypeptidase [Alphaproteobacteria bacterium]